MLSAGSISTTSPAAAMRAEVASRWCGAPLRILITSSLRAAGLPSAAARRGLGRSRRKSGRASWQTSGRLRTGRRGVGRRADVRTAGACAMAGKHDPADAGGAGKQQSDAAGGQIDRQTRVQSAFCQAAAGSCARSCCRQQRSHRRQRVGAHLRQRLVGADQHDARGVSGGARQ